MSAECDKHGVDLHGDTFNGLVCPVCEVEAQRDAAYEALEEIATREGAPDYLAQQRIARQALSVRDSEERVNFGGFDGPTESDVAAARDSETSGPQEHSSEAPVVHRGMGGLGNAHSASPDSQRPAESGRETSTEGDSR